MSMMAVRVAAGGGVYDIVARQLPDAEDDHEGTACTSGVSGPAGQPDG
jgi:hypothetical protein